MAPTTQPERLRALLDDLGSDGVRGLSRAEYERLVALGHFDDERVELLRGVLVAMSPQGPRHAECVQRLVEWLLPALLGRARVRVHSPFAASDDSEPEPDVGVYPPGDHSGGHPDRALLLAEVSETSLRKDRRVKADLYAEVGGPEYWIVDLEGRVIEVLSDPGEGGYQRRERVGAGDPIAPRAFPDVSRADAGELIP